MKGKPGYMAIKLDMSKAYDRVEWAFLKEIMKKLGFVERWISLLMTCVRSGTYFVLVNGTPMGSISPSRGLRQGDPSLPYLFLFCAEGLSSLLLRAESEGKIKGVPISFRGTKISHLFFADDSILFCRTNLTEWNSVQDLLHMYELAFGQKLNSEKTSIFFSHNTPRPLKSHIASLVGSTAMNNYHKYLGLLALVGRSKTQTFVGIQDRVCKRLDGWTERFLSQAGKEILIKTVVQAIPTYSMSVFRLPKTLCFHLNSLMSRFWWRSKKGTKKMAWMSWERSRNSKNSGGMGFRDLEIFNLALLTKQGWQILQNPYSLVARIFKEKYFPKCSFLETTVGRRPSYVWRGISQARSLLEVGLIWQVGNGESISVWHDKWLPNLPYGRIWSPISILPSEAKVAALIDQRTGKWNLDLIHSLFSPMEAERVCGLPLSSGST